MFARTAWAFPLAWVSTVAAQDPAYHFTMGVTSPAPVPGNPFTFTWTGGDPTGVVYIVLNNYFPDTPNQNIIYGSTDILSNAPNNGSWTYTVPLNIEAGRHSFSIGINPLLSSDQTPIFIIDASQTSGYPMVPGLLSSTNTAFQTYDGCGLPPLPDYTYTGYQPPCTVTTDGHLTTLYPVVPVSDTSSFYGSAASVPAPTTQPSMTSSTTSSSSTSTVIYSSPPTINTAFASGFYAQALQCPSPIMPSATSITASGTTTIFSTVGCATVTASGSTSNSGVCHTSGYTTFSVSGTSSVCCPNGWATTPLNSELFCFMSMVQGAKRGVVKERQASTSGTLVELTGLAFTSVGIVTRDVAAGTGSAYIMSASISTKVTFTATSPASATSATSSKSGGVMLNVGQWGMQGLIAVTGALCFLV